MSEKTDKNNQNEKLEQLEDSEKVVDEVVDSASSSVSTDVRLAEKDRRIAHLEKRLGQLEKRLSNNERFARTFAMSVSTQVVAIDAVTDVVRRSLQNDAKIQHEIGSAIHLYDKHKIRRWFSGVLSVVLWVASITAAAFIGATIYWLFAAQ